MFTRECQKLWCFTGILFIVAVAAFIKSCHKDSGPATPQEPAVRTVTLNLNVENNPQAKATGLVVELVGLNDNDEPVGPVIRPIVVETPSYPLAIEVSLYVPPCRYLVTITSSLSRDPERVEQGILQMCGEASLDVTVDTFEELQVTGLRIDAPEEVDEGETIAVSCKVDQFSAPDSDRAPLSISLNEHNGRSVSAMLTSDSMEISATFPDPASVSLAGPQRQFQCTISDGRSIPYTIKRSVTRLLPECMVSGEDDSGSGTLRQALANFESELCSSPITFAPGISTIALDSQLEISSGTLTIDGGDSDVTISGENSSRVFWIGEGANVTFKNLTIANGYTNDSGGGVYNKGTITFGDNTLITQNMAPQWHGGGIYNVGDCNIASSAVVTENMADMGGGITNGGTLVVNGTISNNTVLGGAFLGWGGGIDNAGTATINGTVTGNSAVSGGGILTSGSGNLLIVNGIITNNVATDSGGGIFLYDACVPPDYCPPKVVFMSNNLIENNIGNGIYISNAVRVITGVPIYGSGNTPNDCDGPGGCP